MIKCFYCNNHKGKHPHMFYYKFKAKPFFLCDSCELNYKDIEEELLNKLREE